jgi:hypothetical protein
MGKNCPVGDEYWIKNPRLKPEFYLILNNKIKVV